VLLLCVCVHSALKGHVRNDLYCVERDVKFYSFTLPELLTVMNWWSCCAMLCYVGISIFCSWQRTCLKAGLLHLFRLRSCLPV